MVWGSNLGRATKLFCSPKMARLALGPTHPSILWVPEFFPGAKVGGHDVNHSSPSVAKVKNEWSCTFNPHIFLHGIKREILRLLLPPC
jgi:hypothetical protein